jgi:hypothetical protein
MASEKGHRAVVQALLANHADVKTKDNEGCTALFVASAGVREGGRSGEGELGRVCFLPSMTPPPPYGGIAPFDLTARRVLH